MLATILMSDWIRVSVENLGKALVEVLSDRTDYSHTSSQKCCEWIPTKIGIDAWNKGENDDEGSYEVEEIEMMSLAGAASKVDMYVVYTCTLHHCVIHCPCNVCKDPSVACNWISIAPEILVIKKRIMGCIINL